MDAGWMQDGSRMEMQDGDAGLMHYGCMMDVGWTQELCWMDAGWMQEGCRMDAGWGYSIMATTAPFSILIQ